jgi:endo-1,4-beta-xylanase
MKSISLKALLLTASAALGGYAQAQSSDVSCGYAVETGTRAITPHGFVGWARVANVSGPPGAQFELLLDVGDATIRQVAQADFTTTEDGVLITAPSRFQKHPLAPGKNFTFNIIGEGTYSGTTPYLLSVNGIPCDDPVHQQRHTYPHCRRQ